jgi:hypothetical protein
MGGLSPEAASGPFTPADREGAETASLRPMKYQLVLQWPASSVDDYDSMIAIEESLIEELRGDSEVDGHDAGSGQVNIFIRTGGPAKTFEDIKKSSKRAMPGLIFGLHIAT